MRVRPMAVLALFALALAGCGDRSAAGASPTGEEFASRAKRAVAAWEAVGKGRAWTAGFVPLEQLTVLPRDPGFTERTRIAYRLGAYRPAGRLPLRAPRHGVVRWPGGDRLRVGLVDAERAYKALDRGPMSKAVPDKVPPGGPPDAATGATALPCPECDMRVTGARLGTVPLNTSRGVAQVPAWWFTVAELKSPVVRVAVAAGAIGAFPAAPPAPSGERAGPPVFGVEAVPGDARRLRVTVAAGSACVTARGLTYESAHAVVVGAAVRAHRGNCPEIPRADELEVTLARPLDGRVLLDSDGRPLRLGERRPIPA